MSRSDGKVVLVTGAGHGVGEAVARALAEEGAAVGAFDLDGTAAEQVAKKVVEAGGRAIALEGDTRNVDDVRTAVGKVVETYGGLDGLAAIAGVMRLSSVESSEDDDWTYVMETNVRGPFLFVREAVPHLRARGGGAIVLTSSVMAWGSAPGAALYSASKGAIASMTKALGVELAPEGIRVNAVAPGLVRTPMAQNLASEAVPDAVEATLQEWGKVHPIGRILEPEEIARLVSFLLSDEASAITGSTHLADGGMLARLPG